jgi:hypothetical protein
MIETYRWRGGTEVLLRHGGGSPVSLLILPALFEEANRMRRFTVSVMHILADHNIGTILPDLPGCGESLTELVDVTLTNWQDVVSALADEAFGTLAIRGGALLDGSAARRWRLAPEPGERLLRDMLRATSFSEGRSTSELDQQARSQPTRLAGNLIGPALFSALHDATPQGEAHVTDVDGPKLWRAAEPGDDPDYARRIAEDIFTWTKTCAV